MARTQAADYEDRREAIVDKAAALFARKGFLGTSMSELANPHVFPASSGDGAITTARTCLKRLCQLAGIKEVTPHTLRHTFGSMAGELGFSELTIRAMLGHASQNITQDYIHIDEALKIAVQRTSDEIARLLAEGSKHLDRLYAASGA